MVRLAALSLFLLSAIAPTHAAEHVRLFVSAMTEKQVIALDWNPDNATLTELGRLDLPDEPSALLVAPDGRRLYITMLITGQLGAAKVDPASGKMELLNVVPAGKIPCYMSLDPSGRSLLTAYYTGGNITVHALDNEGRIATKPRQNLVTTEKAHCIVFDPSQKWVFAAHTGGEAIFQYTWNPTSSELVPLSPGQVTTKPLTGPRHIAWSPSRAIAYVSNEQANSATAWELTPEHGLKPAGSASTLPPAFTEPNSTSDIQVHPSGKSVYVANRGHESLAILAVSDDGLQLSPAGHVATERNPRSFMLDAKGEWLFAAGEDSGKLAIYAVSKDGRELNPVKSVPLAGKLWWVAVQK